MKNKSISERAKSVIRKAEEEIKSLIDCAVENRQYQQVRSLASVAEKLAAILDDDPPYDSDSLTRKKNDQVESKSKSDCSSVSASGHKKDDLSSSLVQLEGPKNSLSVDDYPYFCRDDDSLNKIGWSRAKNAVYEHRASKSVLDAVVRRAVSQADSSNRTFTAEAISDVKEQKDHLKIPGYQLYLCLAWLKRVGIIKQKGRKKYVLVDVESFKVDLEEAWSRLSYREAKEEKLMTRKGDR